MSEIPYAALIGLDWADQKHDVCLYDCTTQTQEHYVIGARPEAIEAWAMQLRLRYGGQPIALCLEQKRGPLIYVLCKYEFFVLYPVNPQTVSKYRQALLQVVLKMIRPTQNCKLNCFKSTETN
jgi:hypothetical protein